MGGDLPTLTGEPSPPPSGQGEGWVTLDLLRFFPCASCRETHVFVIHFGQYRGPSEFPGQENSDRFSGMTVSQGGVS